MLDKVAYFSEWMCLLGSQPPSLLRAHVDELAREVEESRTGLQMLPLRQSIRLRDQFGQDDRVLMPPDWVPLWDDGESNFLGIHYRGLLSGWIAVIDHDGDFDTTPLFRSVQTFRRALKNPGAFDWRALIFDYPQDGEVPSAPRADTDKEQDRSLALQLISNVDKLAERRDRSWTFLTVMALLSQEDEPHYVNFLTHPDPEIRSRACRMIGFHRSMIGFHRIESQLPTLISLARTDEPVRAAALYAIGQMRLPTSPHTLVELLKLFPERRHQFAHSFELCGLTPKAVGGLWEVQIPNGDIARF